MSGDSKKDWERPWSTEEIVEHADNWNLACDAALLNTLKAFGDKILNKSEEVHNKLENLCDNLEQTSLRVDLARNEFNSLRNTQFMEFRVYEEDETLLTADQQEEKVENNVPKEESMEDLRKSVALGLEILDKHYEKVEVTVSDSEDDDEEGPSYVYRRKDPYINRPLPYVIGSEEWYKKWHVGLLESSDSENEKTPSEKFSDSEDEEPFQVKDHSDVSSELSNLSGLNNNDTKRLPSAFSKENAIQNDEYLPSTSESDVSAAPTPKVANFAEQLAAKLGNVIKENRNLLEEPEVNRRPIQKKPSDYGALFSDEPPPLDEDLTETGDSHGIFSGGKGLFDDEDEDDSLWNPGKSDKPTRNQEESNVIAKDNLSKGLFEEDSDDDIFSSAKRIGVSQHKQPYLQSNKTAAPIFNEEPPLLDDEVEVKEKKKPPGGVSPFGNASIFQSQKIGDILKQRKRSSSETSNGETSPKIEPEIREKDENVEQIISTVPKESKKTDLLEDSKLKKEEKRIFEKKEEPVVRKKINETPKDLFDDSSIKIPKTKTGNLFDDDIFGDELFSEIDRKNSNLFSDGTISSAKEKQEIIPSSIIEKSNIRFEDNEKPVDIKNEYDYSWRKSSKSKISSLFDDDEDDDYDLFKTNKIEEKPSDRKEVDSIKSNILPEKEENLSKNKKVSTKVNLFNDDFEDVDDLFSEILKNDRKKSENNTEKSKIFEEKLEKSEICVEKLEKSEVVSDDENSTEIEDVLAAVKSSQSSNVLSEVIRSSISVPHISFLDNVPPPEDGWDNSSDNAIDDLEPYGNDDFQSQPSTLFDHEPPSLFYNNSSGIVQDHRSNRLESVNSFEPTFSSTRRLSDMPCDSDNIFLTENEDFLNIPGQSSLPSVPEVSDSHSVENTDLTPSGNTEDFHSTGNVSARSEGLQASEYFGNSKIQDSSVTGDKMAEKNVEECDEVDKKTVATKPQVAVRKPDVKNKPEGENSKKEVSFEDIFGEDETDDLFTTKKAQLDPTDSSDQLISESIIADKDENLDRDEKKTSEDSVKFVEGDDMQSNGSKISEKIQQLSRKNEDAPKNIAIPGRLTHKLQINVGALMPGFVPPRKDKTQIPEETNENSLSKSLPASKFDQNQKNEGNFNYSNKPVPITRTVSESDTIRRLPRLEKSVSFDNTTDTEILRSMTKERPKIQVKRRPSSRKARQESLRKSVADFRLLGDSIANETEEQFTKESFKDDSKVSNENQEIPGQNQCDKKVKPNQSEEIEKPNQSEIVKPENIENFRDETDVQKDSAPKSSKFIKNVFEDEDDENDDLFKNIQKDVRSVNQAKIISTKKKDIFSDDDDLFDVIKSEPVRKGEDVLKEQSEDMFSTDTNIFSKRKLDEPIDSKVTERKSLSTTDVRKLKNDNLFDSSDDSDDFLGARTKAAGKKDNKNQPISVIGKIVEKKSKNLFDSSDDEGDFLGSIGGSKSSKETQGKPAASVKTRGSALFSDGNDDDEDIFGSSGPSNKTKYDIQPSVIDKKAPKSSSLRKLGTMEGEDPLSALLK